MTSTTPHALPISEMIEEFRIVRILGSGAFGIVYECQNTYLPETVAIKEFLPPELAYRGSNGRVTSLSEQTEETFHWARDRFLQEAKTLWELARPERHLNIVRVTRYCEANGTAYMFMELEEGRPLSEILDERRQLSTPELDDLFYPLLDGLERIHSADVLHRDIKPANILIRADGSPVLIDFGAARRAVAGGERSVVSAFTPVYAALEQYHDVGEQGPWTDIYGFGATLYQAVTGRKPLSASERLCGGDHIPAMEECLGSYPEPMLNAIDQALAIKPGDRPQSVQEWRRCLTSRRQDIGADDETVVMGAFGPNDPTRVISSVRAIEPTGTARSAARVAEPQETGRRNGRVWFTSLALSLVLIGLGVGWFHRDTILSVVKPWLGPPERISGAPTEIADSREEPVASEHEEESTQMVTSDAIALVVGEEEDAESREYGPAAQLAESPTELAGKDIDEAAPDMEPVAVSALADTATESADVELQDEERPSRPKPEPGERFSDDLASGGSGPIMVWLPAGEFQMGSSSEEIGRNSDERLHPAQIPEPFAVSETEITLGEYSRFIDDTGYKSTAGGGLPCLKPDESWQRLVEDWSLSWESPGYEVTNRHPVTCVSWVDAQGYADWLTKKTGYRYRLPTELEWEYAARAGTSTSRFWGDDARSGCNFANTAECDDEYIYAAPAGTFPPNPFELREMLGNLSEWTCSEYGKGYTGVESQCSEGADAAPRVFRGGSWLDAPELVRSAARDGAPANLRLNSVGFRLIRTLSPDMAGKEAESGQIAERQ